LTVVTLFGVLGAAAISACAEDSSASTIPVTSPEADAGAAPTGVVVDVQALDNTFRPERVEIAVGDEVVWTNGGRNEHDVLHVEGDDWGVTVDEFQPGDEYRHVFSEPGEYRYYCTIHGTAEVGMVGTVVVGA
jgi:plastocyanin